jgi:hypothetical protein
VLVRRQLSSANHEQESAPPLIAIDEEGEDGMIDADIMGRTETGESA